MKIVNDVLKQAQPFVAMVALLFGIIAAWHGLSELLPMLKQIWAPRGSAQSMAIVGAALAIIAGKAT